MKRKERVGKLFKNAIRKVAGRILTQLKSMYAIETLIKWM